MPSSCYPFPFPKGKTCYLPRLRLYCADGAQIAIDISIVSSIGRSGIMSDANDLGLSKGTRAQLARHIPNAVIHATESRPLVESFAIRTYSVLDMRRNSA
jgi:hypothetical protein